MKKYSSPKMGKVGNRPVPSKGGNTEPSKGAGNRMGGAKKGNSKYSG